MALGSVEWSLIANRLTYQRVIVVKKFPRFCENISDKKKKYYDNLYENKYYRVLN